jgi:hypothetical protein
MQGSAKSWQEVYAAAPSQDDYTNLEDNNPWPWGIIKDSSVLKERWDIAAMLCILYSAAVVPVRICFGAESEGFLWFFETSISLFFVADLVVSFNTAYMLDDGRWATDRGQIAQRYMRGWFWIDAPSSVPVELIDLAFEHQGSKGPSALPAFRVLRMLRLVRMLRIVKVGYLLSRLEEHLEVRPLDVAGLDVP